MVAISAHGFADVLLEQGLRREQIVTVVLLQHVHATACAPSIASVHGLRLDVSGHVAKLELDFTGTELGQLAHFTHEAEVLVVNGDADLLAIVGGGQAVRRSPGRRATAGAFVSPSATRAPHTRRARQDKQTLPRSMPHFHRCFSPCSTPTHAYAISQFGFRARREPHIEGKGARVLLRRRQTRG